MKFFRKKQEIRPQSQEQVDRAKEALDRVAAEKPGNYENSYEDELKDLYDRMTQRPDFQYDLEGDPLYRQYRQSYVRQGQTAMEDTLGKASGLTGGYGSSFAQSAAHQQYNRYLTELGNLTPALYDRAYDRYQDQGKALEQQYAELQGLEAQEYARYSDRFQQWLREYGMALDEYEHQQAQDFKEKQEARRQQEREQDRQDKQSRWEAEMELKRQKDKSAGKSSGSSSGKGGKGSKGAQKDEPSEPPYQPSEHPDHVHTNGMHQKDVEGWAGAYLQSGQDFPLESREMEQWMKDHGIYGSATEAFLDYLRNWGYPRSGVTDKHRRDVVN